MRTRHGLLVTLPTLAALALGPAGHAETRPAHRPGRAAVAGLERPEAVARVEQAGSGPVWTALGLWPAPPEDLYGLAAVLDRSADNTPVWDPGSRAWYAFVYGALVRVEPEGSLPVVLAQLPGHDFDLRAARGVLVYRDPDRDQIVLQRLDRPAERRVLLEGAFYHPRLSPDGSRLAVSELRDGGGHLWLVDTASGEARDLGPGYDPAWRPDGRRLIYLRLDDNGHALTASHLHEYDPARDRARLLASTRAVLITRPCYAPDGQRIAFVDAVSLQVMVAALPAAGGAR